MYLTDLFQRVVIHSSGGCESCKNKIIGMNINWWIRNIRPNYCISEFKCDLNSNRVSSKTCNDFRVIIILYTIDLYVVLIPQNESKWNKIVSIQTMSNPKILCLPPVANTLRDLDMRFTWVILLCVRHNNTVTSSSDQRMGYPCTGKNSPWRRSVMVSNTTFPATCFIETKHKACFRRHGINLMTYKLLYSL